MKPCLPPVSLWEDLDNTCRLSVSLRVMPISPHSCSSSVSSSHLHPCFLQTSGQVSGLCQDLWLPDAFPAKAPANLHKCILCAKHCARSSISFSQNRNIANDWYHFGNEKYKTKHDNKNKKLSLKGIQVFGHTGS